MFNYFLITGIVIIIFIYINNSYKVDKSPKKNIEFFPNYKKIPKNWKPTKKSKLKLWCNRPQNGKTCVSY